MERDPAERTGTGAVKPGRRRGGGTRSLRAVASIAATLVALVLILLVGAPLMVRGPVLTALVRHGSRNLCGSIVLSGGHLSPDTLIALIFQRPFDIALDGVNIREPEGDVLLRARIIRVRLAVLRHPWRVVVDHARVGDGAWTMRSWGKNLAVTVALSSVPAGGRGACRQPTPPAATPAKRPTLGSVVVVRGVRLQNFSPTLSFSSWAVALKAIDATGTFEVRGTPDGQEILFDARNVVAKGGGTLRVGPGGHPRSLEVPLDEVSIPRVAVTDAAPSDLQLEVREARTGAAVLSGRASFTNVFSPGSRQAPSGMDLSAEWRDLGRALARSSGWADVGRPLAALHVGLRTTLHGPFDALLGSAALAGKGISLQARSLPGGRLTMDTTFKHLDTTPLLERAQRARFAGRLDGRLAVSARLGNDRQRASVTLGTIELALARSHAGAGPRRWVVSRSSRPTGRDDLGVTLGEVALRDGAMIVDPLRVQAPDVNLAVRLRAERTGSARERLRPGHAGTARRQPTASGLALSAWFSPESRVTWRGETFFLPPLLRLDRDPQRALAVTPFTIRHGGGGTIDAGGAIRNDGAGDLRAAVHAYPLAHLPGLARARAPGQRALVGDALRGWLNVSLRVTGTDQSPSLSGTLHLDDVRWGQRPLGRGAIVFDGIRDGTRFQGPLLDGINLRGQLTRHAERQDFVEVALRDLALGPWLPAPAAPLNLRASGNVVWRPRDATTKTAATAVDLRVRGTGVDAHATARLRSARSDAALQARLDLAPLVTAFPALRLRQSRGAVTADLRWQGSAAGRAPRIDGTIAVREALTLWPTWMRAPVTIAPAQIVASGDQVSVAELVVHAPGAQATLAGTLKLRWDDPGASALAGSVDVVVDGNQVGPWISDPSGARGTAGGVAPAGVAGSGSADFSAAVSGTLRAPHVRGQARFQALTVSWPGSAVGAVRLDGPLAFDDRRLAVGPLLVRLQSGGWVMVGGSRGPGRLVLEPRQTPLPLSDVDLTVRGAGLSTQQPVAGVSVRGLGLALSARQTQGDTVHVTGPVYLGHIHYRMGKSSSKSSASSDKPAPRTTTGAPKPRVIDRVRADQVMLYGPPDTVRAKVGRVVPTVTVGVRCVVDGPLSAPHIAGQIKGDGLYSRAALAIADWFTSRNLRGCDLGPH